MDKRDGIDEFYHIHEQGDRDNDCFFMKILQECSQEVNKQMKEEQPEYNYVNESMEKQNDKGQMVENWLWKEQEQSEEFVQDFEPILKRARSLRMEQERKISNFVQVFGSPKIGQVVGEIRTFSPRKTKRITKLSKPTNIK